MTVNNCRECGVIISGHWSVCVPCSSPKSERIMSEEKTRPDELGYWWWWLETAKYWTVVKVINTANHVAGRYVKIREEPPSKPVVLPDKPTAFTATYEGDKVVGVYSPREAYGIFHYILATGSSSSSAEWFLQHTTNIKWLGGNDG